MRRIAVVAVALLVSLVTAQIQVTAQGGPPIKPLNHQPPLLVYSAFSSPKLTQGPHGSYQSLDYALSTGADTLYWDTNPSVGGALTQPQGPFQLWNSNAGPNGNGIGADGRCIDPVSTGTLYSTAHTERMARIVATYEQQNFTNEYWHMGTVSANGNYPDGSSFGTQASFTSGCKYYSWGQLATTGPHIHHYWASPTTCWYPAVGSFGLIYCSWTPLDP